MRISQMSRLTKKNASRNSELSKRRCIHTAFQCLCNKNTIFCIMIMYVDVLVICVSELKWQIIVQFFKSKVPLQFSAFKSEALFMPNPLASSSVVDVPCVWRLSGLVWLEVRVVSASRPCISTVNSTNTNEYPNPYLTDEVSAGSILFYFFIYTL